MTTGVPEDFFFFLMEREASKSHTAFIDRLIDIYEWKCMREGKKKKKRTRKEKTLNTRRMKEISEVATTIIQ